MFGPMRIARPRKCPHERIEHCPMYVESHRGTGLGCIGDDIMECDVTRGLLDYDREVLRIKRGDA